MSGAAILVAIAIAMCCSSDGRAQAEASPSSEREDAIRQATEVKDRNLEKLFKLPQVVGAGVGFSSKHPDQPVIQVYVSRQPSARQMRQFPKSLEGIPVEIVVTGPVKALPDSRPQETKKDSRK